MLARQQSRCPAGGARTRAPHFAGEKGGKGKKGKKGEGGKGKGGKGPKPSATSLDDDLDSYFSSKDAPDVRAFRPPASARHLDDAACAWHAKR